MQNESLRMAVFGLLASYGPLDILETIQLLIERDRLLSQSMGAPEDPRLTELVQSLGKPIAIAETLTTWEIN
jgi:hypothetical protein